MCTSIFCDMFYVCSLSDMCLFTLCQVNFTLVAGNMQDVFKIKTVNHTYGEVYVNAPLDRESVDRYLLKVRQRFTASAFCFLLKLL